MIAMTMLPDMVCCGVGGFVEAERERLSVGTQMELATRVWGGLCERYVFLRVCMRLVASSS
jgi:hypothetical protein